MDDAYFERRAREIFESIRYATIATSDSQGNPWNSPVYSTHDGDVNIYWVSDRQNQHSQNVRQNPNVFIVFYDSTVPPGSGEGVYLRAKVIELSDADEIRRARQIIGGGDANSSEKFVGDGVRRVYRAVPTEAWMNTTEVRDGVFIRDYRVEVPLTTLKSR